MAECVEDKMQVIEVMKAALADDPQLLTEEEREDVSVTIDKVSPQPEAVLVSEIVLEEDTVCNEMAVMEPLTDLALVGVVQTVAVVEDITFISSEGPISSEETVVSELQETQGPESNYEVDPPEDTGSCEPTEAPEIQDEPEMITSEVASVVEITSSSEAPLEFSEGSEVALALLRQNTSACEASSPNETEKLSEAMVLDDDASTSEGEEMPLIEAQAQVEPSELCETALFETEVQLSVAPQEVTSLEEPEAALAEAPVNWEASEHAEEPTLTESTAAPAPEEECEAADLDLEEEVPASLPIILQTFSEERLSPQAETIDKESLAETASEEDARAVESMSADLGTVSIFR